MDDYTRRYEPEVMNRTWLIQRLQPPSRMVTTPFTFGCGFVDGGLSKEALQILKDVWTFDYMGAAEFEWGGVPSALNRIARDREFFKGVEITIPMEEVAKVSWGREFDNTLSGECKVYIFGHKDEIPKIETCIRAFARDDTSREYQLKEPTWLHHSLRYMGDKKHANVGWLELNNGFLFFTDKKMFDAIVRLFKGE